MATLEENLRKVPPQNLEAECSVLGGVLLDNAAINRVLELATVEDFYRDSHRKIFSSMLDLDELGEPIDLVTLSERLRCKGELEAVGGTAYLASLADLVPTAVNIGYYARIVRDKSVLRHLISAATEIATRGFEELGNTDEFLEWSNSEISKIVEASKGHGRVDRAPVMIRIS